MIWQRGGPSRIRKVNKRSSFNSFMALTLSFIRRANQWTDFYMIKASAMKELSVR